MNITISVFHFNQRSKSDANKLKNPALSAMLLEPEFKKPNAPPPKRPPNPIIRDPAFDPAYWKPKK